MPDPDEGVCPLFFPVLVDDKHAAATALQKPGRNTVEFTLRLREDNARHGRPEHRLKQHPRWKAEQLTPGTIRWTTPAGRQYTTEPTRYPI